MSNVIRSNQSDEEESEENLHINTKSDGNFNINTKSEENLKGQE